MQQHHEGLRRLGTSVAGQGAVQPEVRSEERQLREVAGVCCSEEESAGVAEDHVVARLDEDARGMAIEAREEEVVPEGCIVEEDVSATE